MRKSTVKNYGKMPSLNENERVINNELNPLPKSDKHQNLIS